MTIAEQTRQEGNAGRIAARPDPDLRRLLGLGLGALDEATSMRLESADSASLDRYAERILTASSVDELFAD